MFKNNHKKYLRVEPYAISCSSTYGMRKMLHGSYEQPITFKKMHDFSTTDGFVEITEDLSNMIKFAANEPSVGLFYIQQHTHNSTPNLLNLKTKVLGKSHETSLQAEDLEDSITMLRSMKECGFPIVDEMIIEVKKSLSIISTKQPKRGLITRSPSAGFLGRTGSWSPATWGQNSLYMRQDGEGRSGYLSGIFRSANSFKGPTVVESKQSSESEGGVILDDLGPMVASAPESFRIAEVEGESFSVSSELREESRLGESLSHQRLITLHKENYDEFKADREAKLEEWLGGTGN